MFFVILSDSEVSIQKTESGLLNLWIFRYAQNDKCLRFFDEIAPCSPLYRFILTHSAQNDKHLFVILSEAKYPFSAVCV